MSENFDLGTAHAKIKFDADERGIRTAERAFSSFERELRAFRQSVERADRSINQLEREISSLRQETADAGREFDRTEGHIRTFNRTNSRSSNIIRTLNSDLSILARRLQIAKHYYDEFNKPIRFGVRFVKEFRSGEDSVRGIGRALKGSGIAAAGFNLALGTAFNTLIGMKAAMASITGWRRSFIQFTTPILATIGTLRLLNRVSNGAIVTMAKKVGSTIPLLQKLSNGWDKNTKGLKQMVLGTETTTRGISKLIINLALAKTAFTGLIKPFMILRRLDPEWILGIVSAVGLLAPALELAGKTLTWFSNILLGTWDAAKQLSGGLLALPGIFTSLLTVMGTVAVAAFGVKDAFKAAFEASDEDFNKALEKLPTKQLKDIAKSVRGVKDEWTALQITISQRAFQGFDKDIETITKIYIPALYNGMGTVATAINQAKNNFIDFATQQSTVDDFGKSFQLTAQIVRNLNKTIKPMGQAFLDIIIVGQEAMADLSAHAGRVSEKFAEWAKINRENGNMRRWIDDAVSGVVDLWRASKNLVQALWEILTIFADRSGENGIERFADSMERFNVAVRKSAASGFLRSLKDAIDGLGTEKLEQLKDLFMAGNSFSLNPLHHFGPQTGVLQLIKDLIPVMRDFGEGFSGTFVPTLKTAMGILKQFADIIDALGLDSLLGTLLGFATGWKLIDKAMGPLIKSFTIILGLFRALKGAGQAFAGVSSIIVGSLNQMGKAKAGDVLNKVFIGFGRLIKVGAAAAAALFLVKQAVDDTNQIIEDNKNRLAESSREFTEWNQGLKEAFLADNGLRGGTILDQLETGVSDFRNRIQQDAESSVSWLEHIKGFFLTAGGATDLFVDGGRSQDRPTFWFSDPQYINDMQNAKANAQETQKAIDGLGLSNAELAGKLASSDAAFNDWITHLQNTGQITAQGVAGLNDLRNALLQTEQAFSKLGPGGTEIAMGIKEISTAGDDATQKLRGLESVLKGLGILQTDAWQTAVAHANSVRELADAANQLVVAEEPLGSSVLFNGDKLNEFSVNAQNLGNALDNAAQNLRDTAIAGEDVDKAYQEIVKTFPDLIKAFQLDPADLPKIQNLFDNYFGANKPTIKAALELDIDPENTNDLLSATQRLQNQVKGIDVPINVQQGGASGSTGPEVEEISKKFTETLTIVQNTSRDIDSNLTTAAQAAGDSGVDLGAKFAAGIESQANRVLGASMKLAQAAGAPLPRSPAKVGPFSGKGYSLFRGRKLSEDFASGIADGAQSVAGASLGMVGGASTSMDEGLGKLFKDLAEFSSFGKNILSIIDNIQSIAFDVIDLVTTDWETGESKLGKVFKKTVSDEDLAIKRADAFQNAIGNRGDDLSGLLNFSKTLSRDDLESLGKGAAKGSEAGLQPAALFTRRLIANMFPQIPEIGGVRADSLQWHPSGRGLDFMVGGDTQGGANPQAKRLGDQIAAFLNANKEALGINHVLWQTMEGGNHFNHVHAGFNQGAKVNIDDIIGLAGGIASLERETKKREEKAAAANPPDQVTGFNKDPKTGELTVKTAPGDPVADATKDAADATKELTQAELNDLTDQETLDQIRELGKQMGATPDETAGALAAALQARDESINREPIDLARDFLGNISQTSRDLPIHERAIRAFPGEVPSGFLGDLVSSSRLLNQQTAEGNQHLGNIDGNTLANARSSQDILNDYLVDNPQLDDLINQTKNGNASTEQNLAAVNALETAIQGTPKDTAENRALREGLRGIQSDIMESGGITETPNVVDQAKTIAGSAIGVAGDIFRVIDQTIKTMEAGHNITSQLIRGIENTKDIENTIDNFQEFIKLGADVAQAVSSVTGAIGSIAGAAGGTDPSGGAAGAAAAIQGISQIAGIVSAALQTVNATIDLAQEGWHIAGKYIGRFLTSISGLAGATGDIKYLLDTNTGILKAYSSDNPLDKQDRQGYNLFPNKNQQQAPVNVITVYGGPGQDPRDTMNDAMWAIQTSGVGAFGYG